MIHYLKKRQTKADESRKHVEDCVVNTVTGKWGGEDKEKTKYDTSKMP